MTEAVTEAPIDITDVRRALVTEANNYYERRKPFFDAFRADDPNSAGNYDIYEAHVTAGSYAWLLAALLRKLAHDQGAEYAAECASLVKVVMDEGTDWLEDANSDLDGMDVKGREVSPGGLGKIETEAGDV